MSQLIPENVIKRLDSLGRVTLPKGLRDRMYLSESSELELFTANIDGRQCICLAKPVDENAELETAVELLINKGYFIITPEQRKKYESYDAWDDEKNLPITYVDKIDNNFLNTPQIYC